ncbi:MAG: DUF3095 family protein [Hyphomicrobiaceae bacterium]
MRVKTVGRHPKPANSAACLSRSCPLRKDHLFAGASSSPKRLRIKPMKYAFLIAIGTCLFGISSASATEHTSVVITFKESAPKDRFEVRNDGDCSVKPMRLRIDLAASQGRLVFDPTASGAGVKVFQPFEVTDGRQMISQLPSVRDGDDKLNLQFESLPPKSTFAFTIDVDDTLVESELGQIHVQREALITCIAPSVHASDHMHFVDGSDGGYAAASAQMR